MIEKKWAKLAYSALAGLTAALVLTPTAAQAALDIPISGSTYSSADVWYESANTRTVTNDNGGEIDVQMDSRPKLSNGSTSDQLKWQIRWGNNNVSNIIYISNSNWNRDISPYTPTGSWFWNRYARYTTCNNCNHNFSGNMNY
ncbi:hypothetical protein ABUL04_21780 [Micromonospora harpali]|uniref:Uncharacterized protein n=1 Tax=Micromonospora harpali TaxID=1490225 RepID=A0ABW1HI83_9ACTN